MTEPGIKEVKAKMLGIPGTKYEAKIGCTRWNGHACHVSWLVYHVYGY
jgi:hypothetical protein